MATIDSKLQSNNGLSLIKVGVDRSSVSFSQADMKKLKLAKNRNSGRLCLIFIEFVFYT